MEKCLGSMRVIMCLRLFPQTPTPFLVCELQDFPHNLLIDSLAC